MSQYVRYLCQHSKDIQGEVGNYLGPVLQSIVSLTSLLVVKILTVLVSAISNSQVFLLKKCECKSYSHFFSKNISVYVIVDDQSFNDTLTNDIVNFPCAATYMYYT